MGRHKSLQQKSFMQFQDNPIEIIWERLNTSEHHKTKLIKSMKD